VWLLWKETDRWCKSMWRRQNHAVLYFFHWTRNNGFWTRRWTFGFHITREVIVWVVERLLSFQKGVGLGPCILVTYLNPQKLTSDNFCIKSLFTNYFHAVWNPYYSLIMTQWSHVGLSSEYFVSMFHPCLENSQFYATRLPVIGWGILGAFELAVICWGEFMLIDSN
jgi:hypothetical protein